MADTTFTGMDIHHALAKAKAEGKQLRVLSNGTTKLRYAEAADPEHICVHVKNGVVTSVT